MTKVQGGKVSAREKPTVYIWVGLGPISTNRPRETDEGTVKFRSVPLAQLVPFGS